MKKAKQKIFVIFGILIILNSIFAYAEDSKLRNEVTGNTMADITGSAIGGLTIGVGVGGCVVGGVIAGILTFVPGGAISWVPVIAACAAVGVTVGGITQWVTGKENTNEPVAIEPTEQQPTLEPEPIPTGSTGEGKCWITSATTKTETEVVDFCENLGFSGYNPQGPYYIDTDGDGHGIDGEIYLCCSGDDKPTQLDFAQQKFSLNNEDCDDSNGEVFTTEQCEAAENNENQLISSGSSTFEDYGCGPINTPWREDQVLNAKTIFENEGISNKIEIHPDIEHILNELVKKAKEKGYTVHALQGYRSYSDQGNLYIENKKKGYPTAKAGYSEHQTGYAVDLYLNDPTKSLDSFHWIDLPLEVIKITEELGIVHPWPEWDPPHYCIPANAASVYKT